MTFNFDHLNHPLITFFIVAIIFLFFLNALNKVIKGRQSNSWARKKATIKYISIETSSDDEDTLWHKPKIKYSYRINTRHYVCKRYSYKVLETTSYNKLSKRLNGIRAGKEVTVYINPRKPRQAVIERGTNWKNYIELILSVLVLGLIINGFGNNIPS